jgi:hypothetical protein
MLTMDFSTRGNHGLASARNRGFCDAANGEQSAVSRTADSYPRFNN